MPAVVSGSNQYALTGSGSLSFYGAAGSSSSLGVSADWDSYNATVTGSVTIALTGPVQAGFSSLPRNFTFKIVEATGQYAGSTDKGKATLQEVATNLKAFPQRSFMVGGHTDDVPPAKGEQYPSNWELSTARLGYWYSKRSWSMPTAAARS